MRIKKVSQTTATQAQVVNNENNSQLNAYSCDYVNNKVKDVYSTDEIKTNKIWIDGKPIYRKVYEGMSVNDISFIIDTSLKSGTTVLTDCGGYFSQSSRGEKMNVGGYLNQNWYNGIYLDPEGLRAYISTALRNSPYKVWVEYTKNTD